MDLTIEKAREITSNHKAFYEVKRGRLSLFSYRYVDKLAYQNYPEAKELRGIIFDNKTGKVVSKPFHKFFNLYEPGAPEHFSNKLIVAEKIDGYMVQAFLYRNKVHFAGRVSLDLPKVGEIIKATITDDDIKAFEALLLSHKPATLLLEVYDQDNPVLVRYASKGYKVLALRKIDTGEYLFPGMDFGIKYGLAWSKLGETPHALHERIKHLKGFEGYVVYDMELKEFVKLKTGWAFALAEFLKSPSEHFVQALEANTLDNLYNLTHGRADIRASLDWGLNEVYTMLEEARSLAKALANVERKHAWEEVNKAYSGRYGPFGPVLANITMDIIGGEDPLASFRRRLKTSKQKLAQYLKPTFTFGQVLDT